MTASRGVQYGNGLVRGLGTWQILCITISGTIGIGFATTTGEVLAISGPGGVLLAFGVVGVVAIAVMEGVCDMIVLWPISNAMIEFVRAFVDRDLAIVVGIAYWYTYATTLAALVIGSADLLSFWNISYPLLNVTFALFLFTIFVINSRGIRVFGWIELFGGIIKVVVLLVIFIVMICINYGAIGTGGQIGSTFFNDGVRNNPNVASSHFESVLVSIPLAIFSYIGVELVTVTAFEAANPSRMKVPAKHIAYIVMAIYLITIGGFVANIEWFNQHLPAFFGQSLVSLNDRSLGHTPYTWQNYSGSTAAPVIAVLQAGLSVLPGLFTGFLVYSGLSSANTNLYVASRTLYGLTRDLSQTDSNKIVRFFANLNTVSPTTRIPVWALITSSVVFACWLPFVHLHSGYSQAELQETLVAVGSVGCVLVWASQCLAFIRYHSWLSRHRDRLTGPNLERFQRWPITGFSSYAASIQPIPAYIGLVSCLLIVFVLNSISMINRVQLEFKALTIYLGPGLLLLIFIILKIFNRRGIVNLGEWEQLRTTLSTLDALIEGDRIPRPTSHPQPIEPDPYLPSGLYRTVGDTQGPSHQNGAAYSNGGPIAPNLYDSDFVLPPSAAEAARLRATGLPNMPHHQLSDNSLQSHNPPFQNQGPNGGYELSSMNADVPIGAAREVHSGSMDEDNVEDSRRVSALSEYPGGHVRTPPVGYARPNYMAYAEEFREHQEM